MPRTNWGWLITAAELDSWILHRDSDLLVVNKPPHVLCHPSKHGPWSSLVGAAKEFLGDARLHLPSRLDRETSGVVVMARNPRLGSQLQRAIMHRQVRKVYHAILWGEMEEAQTVDRPIGKHPDSAVVVRRGVVEAGQQARTDFTPLRHGGGFTLVRVTPHTGRLHQIRVHAQAMGHPVAGDKIYGPDESLFLDFLKDGWTPRHASQLVLERHALHATEWICNEPNNLLHFTAPMPEDWRPLLEAMDDVTALGSASERPQPLRS